MSTPWSSYHKHIISRENNTLGRQRLILFEFTALLSLIQVFFVGLLHDQIPILMAADMVTIILSVVLVGLYIFHQINIRTASTVLYVCLQVLNSAQMIVHVMEKDPNAESLVLQHLFLGLLFILIAIVSYLKYSPAIISGMSFISFIFCVWKMQGGHLMAFVPVFVLTLIGVIVYDLVAAHGALHLQAENLQMKREVYDFMKVTGLTLEDLKEITNLSKHPSAQTERTRALLASMDARARNNLVGSVMAVKTQNDTSRETLMAAFPNLTGTQISICQLILQDYKQTDLCRALGKTESNISAQRSRIRTVLELAPEEQLKDALQERLDLYLQSRGMNENLSEW